ncbi:hypothetical protein V8C44DRAFT_342672 [Trichoderma aethiopicum]
MGLIYDMRSVNWRGQNILLHVRNQGTGRAVAQCIPKVGQTHGQQPEPVHVRLPRAGHHLDDVDVAIGDGARRPASLQVGVFRARRRSSDCVRGEAVDAGRCRSRMGRFFLEGAAYGVGALVCLFGGCERSGCFVGGWS